MAKGYWVSCYQSIDNPEKLAAYAKLAAPAILAAGGKFIARGPASKAYEQGLLQRTVIVEFDSLAAANAAGFGVWRADSVSELHLASVDTFLNALAKDNPGEAATIDEERFVDRRNSVMFTSAVLWRS